MRVVQRLAHGGHLAVLLSRLTWLLVRRRVWRVRVHGDSMVPTHLPGSMVWCEVSSQGSRLRRGEVVVIRGSGGPEHLVLKRLVALAGDPCEPWECGPGAVPTNSCLVLSDNRQRRGDSREYGAIPLAHVVARVLVCERDDQTRTDPN